MAGPIVEAAEKSATDVRRLPDLRATERLGRTLAGLARPGDIICLEGDLGAGKTALARAFIGALARRSGAARVDVPSPTFTLVQIYEFGPAAVWHFDLYRLQRPDEVYELGFEEALAGAISLIEWPDRLGPLLPAERLDVVLSFSESGDGRRAVITGYGSWAERIARLNDRSAP